MNKKVYFDPELQYKRINAVFHDREEALDILRYDMEVEKMKNPADDLTTEQKGVVKKLLGAINKNERKKPMEKKTHARKENTGKRYLIELVAAALQQAHGINDFNVDNPERLIAFTYEGKRYTITLTEKRK